MTLYLSIAYWPGDRLGSLSYLSMNEHTTGEPRVRGESMTEGGRGRKAVKEMEKA